jgi:phytoene dehydrogenase-like protein
MGAITQAMASEARRLGVTLETGAPVRRILAAGERATGIELEDGRVIEATAIAANLGPKPLFLGLLAEAQ